MVASWDYPFQYIIYQLLGLNTTNLLFEIFGIVIYGVAGLFLFLIIYELYKDYRRDKLTETLLFLLGMIFLIISNVLVVFSRLCYATWGLPGLGELLTINMYLSAQICYLFVNAFAIRVTYPKRFNVIFIFLLVLSGILLGTQSWAIIQGPPHTKIVDFAIFFSIEIILIRIILLIPFGAIPVGVFFYFAKKVRNENKANSNRSIWFGIGILLFVIAIVFTSISRELSTIQVLFIPAAIIFYVCFAMPDWFKRRIGWAD